MSIIVLDDKTIVSNDKSYYVLWRQKGGIPIPVGKGSGFTSAQRTKHNRTKITELKKKRVGTDEEGRSKIDKEIASREKHVKTVEKKTEPKKEISKTVVWKPVMSKQEADNFSKDSKVKDTMFHTTNAVAHENIRKEGFRISEAASFGQGVYFSNNKKSTEVYGDTTAKVLNVKINVDKMLTGTPGSLRPTLTEVRETALNRLTKRTGKKPKILDLDNEIRGVLRSRGFDGITVNHKEGEKWHVVFDPKKIAVFGE